MFTAFRDASAASVGRGTGTTSSVSKDAGIAAWALSDRELALSVARHLEAIPYVCAACGLSGGLANGEDMATSCRL